MRVPLDDGRRPEFADQALANDIAVVLGDTAGRWPRLDWLTSDSAYARLHDAVALLARLHR